MMLDRESGTLLLQDEIRCSAEDTVRWSAHTPAAIRLFESGKAALLSIDGVKMYAVLMADGVFEARAGVADENSPHVYNPNANAKPENSGQATNQGMQKLVVHLSGKTHYTLAVRFYPLTEGREIPTEKIPVKPLSLW